MRKTIFAFGLATGLATNLASGDTLRLKLEPDRGFLLSGSPQEVVVKIDLTAAGHKKKLKRTPLNLAVVLDRSGSMTGSKIEKARQAAMGLVDQLAPGDLFSLIAYSDNAEVLVPRRSWRIRRRSSRGFPASVRAAAPLFMPESNWAQSKSKGTCPAGGSIASSCCPTG
jgi:Ca-activated chloride channel family protein